ncbi:UxaA family hydrolase [Rhodovibrio salinarum]|uniref:Altronate dehydratase n=1 Tax=Rhodovibrio salinarum TaxID=1087 RepID=A0A934QLH7_9PROT|nr:altronate dehydratase family protein [Rhodovibrio salinarum]MBK1699111.1 altronate dehydratase [Rhodovibrio salinarum]
MTRSEASAVEAHADGQSQETAAAAVVRLHPDDNVVVARRRVAAGSDLPGLGIVCRDDIPAGHKVAARAIESGAAVRKYGQIIGFATQDIAEGQQVHTHNCGMGDFERDYAYGSEARPTDYVPEAQRATFQGIVRPDGQVATRNYIGVLTTVNCSATVARAVADAFRGPALDAYPNVDGVAAFVHGTGCGMAGSGEGFELLQRTLHGYLMHPNFAGVLLIGLGCEMNQIHRLMERYGLQQGSRFDYMTIQEAGGTRAAVSHGVERVQAMLPDANAIRREQVSAAHLKLALQCGGSDGYSGITANPALGAAADKLVRHGGTAILSETPEIYGAEHLLTRRAASREVGEKLVERIRWWEDYTARHSGNMDNNPSPGNKEGGLTTILEKSLGAAAKGGTTRLENVYGYAEPIDSQGFVFMDSPGYDPCSVTGQIASGANLVCFTTGRGSVSGFKPAPSLKLSTNTATYQRMSGDMDINCGAVLDEGVAVEEMGDRIFDLVLRAASGEQTCSEALDFGDNEFVPWQIGAVM